MILFNLLAVSLASAGLAAFLKLCLEDGMLFGRYGRRVRRIDRDVQYLVNLRIHNDCKLYRKYHRKYIILKYIFKPLGGCIYCYGAWIAIGIGVYEYGIDMNIAYTVGISHIMIKVIDKWL